MDIKLIAFDMDGTFFDDRKEIPEENIKAICEAAERGIHIVPATGRPLSGMPKQVTQLPFIRYYILINGAQVYDAVEEKVIYKGEIPLEMALKLSEYMDTLPVIYDCYQYDTGWMSAGMYEQIDDYVLEPGINAHVKRIRKPVPDLKELLRQRGDNVQKQQMFFKDMDELARQTKLIPRIFPELLTSTSVKTNIEVNHISAGKDKGLEALCTHLGFTAENAMALGDGTNDTCMLKVAGLGVAMSNAEKEVLEAADVVTDSNNEAGVAKAIYRYALK